MFSIFIININIYILRAVQKYRRNEGTELSFTLHNPDFSKRDPRVFIYNFPNYVEPVKLSKSFSNYLHNNSLYLMESVAAHNNQLIVPFAIFTWRRIKRMKEQNYFYFKIGRESYFMIDAAALKSYEIEKLNHYLNDLDWNGNIYK